jgi:hypothetical protein
MEPMSFRLLLLAAAVVTAACSPTLNWREVRPAASGATALFPCKPAHQTRKLMLAGAAVEMTLHACSAGGTTWALGFADLGDPARVAAALAELADAATRNVAAARTGGRALEVPGMTPNPQAQRLVLIGERPDGSAVRNHVALFSKGTWVFQATVVGAEPPADAVETFFGALRLTP